jgi:integrase
VVDCGLIDGRRVRYALRTKEEAEGKAALCRAERGTNGKDSFTLGKFDRADVEAALEILKPHGFTLLQAAKFTVANSDILQSSKSVETVVKEFLQAKAQDGRSRRHLTDLRLKLVNGFSSVFGTRDIHSITNRELEDWLRSRSEWGPLTRNNYATALGNLFGFALKRGFILKDPTDRLERATVQLEKPGILSVAECRALLAAAAPDFKAAIALALFAGLRPEAELMRLDWRSIDLKENLIDINHSKNSASYRFVKIEPNLAAWLAAYRKDSGPVCPQRAESYYQALADARERAATALTKVNLEHSSLDDWPQDAMRHTFASMHYAQFKNAGATCEQMGHVGGLRIFFRHYRNRVKDADANRFWLLVPHEPRKDRISGV